MDYYADIGIQILFYVMLGVGLNLLLGYTGQVSMAHATFYGLGAYTAGLLTLPIGQGVSSRGVSSGLGWSIYPALVVAILIAFVGAAIVSLPATLRVRGEYLILLTLAVQIVANQLMNSLDSVTGGPYGLTPIPPISFFGNTLLAPQQAFWWVLVAALVAVLVAWRIGESPFGRLLKGIREHEVAVRAVGKNTFWPTMVVFSVAAAIAGGAGAINAYYFQFIAPGTYNLDLSIFVVAIVVLGGAGNLTGTIVGATLLGVLRPILQSFVGNEAAPWQAVIYAGALILLVRFRPEGIVPEGVGVGDGLRALLRRAGAQPAGELALAGAAGRIAVAPPGADAEPPPAPRRDGDGAAPAEPVVRIEGLSKSFGGLRAVDGVTFSLQQGKITALLGPNGAGKTTIFNLITGTLKPDEGRVALRGEEITGLPPDAVAKRGMARSFQDVRAFHRISALENVAVAVPGQPGENLALLATRPLRSLREERRTRAKAREALAFVGLESQADEVVGNLSFGDQKLVAIARLLATECSVLLLDEPTSGVDPGAVEGVVDVILGLRDLGRTICIVEHSVHFVERLADHVVFMDQGRVIAEGTMADLTAQAHLTEIYFGT